MVAKSSRAMGPRLIASIVIAAGTVGGGGAITGSDFTQLAVGIIAAAGIVIAAFANTRGRKQEAMSSAMNINIEANDKLIDQLQEMIASRIEDNDRLRDRIERLDKRVAELENYLELCQKERSRLTIEINSLKSQIAQSK